MGKNWLSFYLAVQKHFNSRIKYLRVRRALIDIIKPISNFSRDSAHNTALTPSWHRYWNIRIEGELTTSQPSPTLFDIWHSAVFLENKNLSRNGVRRWIKLRSACKREEKDKRHSREALEKGCWCSKPGRCAQWPRMADTIERTAGSPKAARLSDCRRLPLGWISMLGCSLHIFNSESSPPWDRQTI